MLRDLFGGLIWRSIMDQLFIYRTAPAPSSFAGHFLLSQPHLLSAGRDSRAYEGGLSHKSVERKAFFLFSPSGARGAKKADFTADITTKKQKCH